MTCSTTCTAERVYREAELEVDARNWHREMLTSRHLPPSPAAVLHQEMVHTTAQQRQPTTERIAWCGRVDTWKAAMDSEAGSSNIPPAPCGDDDHLY
jgi:hypothetical protein